MHQGGKTSHAGKEQEGQRSWGALLPQPAVFICGAEGALGPALFPTRGSRLPGLARLLFFPGEMFVPREEGVTGLASPAALVLPGVQPRWQGVLLVPPRTGERPCVGMVRPSTLRMGETLSSSGHGHLWFGVVET